MFSLNKRRLYKMVYLACGKSVVEKLNNLNPDILDDTFDIEEIETTNLLNRYFIWKYSDDGHIFWEDCHHKIWEYYVKVQNAKIPFNPSIKEKEEW